MKKKKDNVATLSIFVSDVVAVFDVCVVSVQEAVHRVIRSVSDFVDSAFGDFESKSNFVGLYNLLLRVDRRNNPQLYD